MSLFWIIIVGLIVFLLTAGVTEFFRNGNKKPTPKKSLSVKPIIQILNWECREYWSPEEIDQRASFIAVRNENMAALDGHHKIEQKDNLITPIVPQWHSRDKGVELQ